MSGGSEEERREKEKRSSYERRYVTREDLRHPRRILSNSDKSGNAIMIAVDLVVIAIAGSLFFGRLIRSSSTLNVFTLAFGVVLLLFGRALYKRLGLHRAFG